MKNCIILLVLAIAALFLYGCPCCEPKPSEGISGIKHGSPWNANLVDTIKNDTVSLYGIGDVDRLRIKFYLDPGVTQSAYSHGTPYVLKNYKAAYEVFITGTHNEFIYKPDTTRVNTINLVSLPPSAWLTGFFSFTLKLSNPTGNMAFDTARVNFSSGWFNIKIRN